MFYICNEAIHTNDHCLKSYSSLIKKLESTEILAKKAKTLCSMSTCVVDNTFSSLYIAQREYAVLSPSDNVC